MITVATEAWAQTLAQFQQLFDESTDKPQYTPEEIDAVYPNLRKFDNRAALLRVAKASKTERGEHLRSYVATINWIHSQYECDDAWEYLKQTFSKSSNADLKKYLLHILLNYSLPCPDTWLEESLETLKGVSPMQDEILDHYPEEITDELLDDLFHKYAGELQKLKTTRPADAEIKELELQQATSFVQQIYLIEDEDFADLWREVVRGYMLTNLPAAAAHIIHVMRLFYRPPFVNVSSKGVIQH